MAQTRIWTRTLVTFGLITGLVSAGTLLAGKGGKGGGKPPQDDPPPAVNISYSMTLPGSLGGSSEATGMNEQGDIVGYSGTGDGGVKPFVYLSETGTIHNLYDFFTPADRERWISFWPYDINDQGQIAGGAYQPNADGTATEFAVRFTPEQTDADNNLIEAVVEIVGPPGFESHGAGINRRIKRGQVHIIDKDAEVG